jgi:hypothetical protein
MEVRVRCHRNRFADELATPVERQVSREERVEIEVSSSDL